jgi:hypothetical protein
MMASSKNANFTFSIVPQDIPYQAKACQSSKAKQTHSTMDPIEDW